MDGGAPITLDLEDHNFMGPENGLEATVASAIVYTWTGNQSVEHTVVFSVHPGDEFVVLDMLTYASLNFYYST